MHGSLRIWCLGCVPLRTGQPAQLLESVEWEKLLTGSCKQLPLLAFHINPQFFPLVPPCSISAMSMSSPSLVNTQGGFEDSSVITPVVV